MNLQKLSAVSILASASWFAASGIAGAVSLTTSGTWSDIDPTSGITGGGTNQISWGNPSNPSNSQSSYVFDGVSTMSNVADLTTSFLLGTFTHNNFPITGTSLDSATLNVNLGLDTLSETFAFGFNHNETNNATPCDPTGTTVCPDVVTFLNNSSSTQSILLDGVEYALAISGFSTDGGATLTSQFVTEEGQANNAQLFGQLTPATPIPTPAMLPGLVGMGIAAIRKRQRVETEDSNS
ncbi:THxN family PEP-CTERM protein [cf. Phormidesmis sp. LEGE 11477]|uniref:THxN family PEP-CTERM protein n=1 Tax=cf. Phormidesmis sp. LEGE 11477 TaxID=1828680 RepID=UPI001880E494|nr:THxN family PEP-CTERM protein [cf. Phormidesmis sp. LEGE 11477]MBE9063631.1 THxN family PEP-CTERM protein [cf. Phormidesmis sp. LEGE 11477]